MSVSDTPRWQRDREGGGGEEWREAGAILELACWRKRMFKKRNKKKAKSKHIKARNGKDKVKGNPSEENTT
ncbi:hypothetical protein Tco_0917366 [Tanacetum coccineum]